MIIWSKYPCIDALGFSRRATACPALAFRTTSISVCRLQRGIRIAVRGAAARRASTCDGRTRIFIPTLLGPLGSLRFTNTPRAFSALHLHDFKQPAFALEIWALSYLWYVKRKLITKTYSRLGLAVVFFYHVLPLALVGSGAHRIIQILTARITIPITVEGMVCSHIQILSCTMLLLHRAQGTWCSAGAAPKGLIWVTQKIVALTCRWDTVTVCIGSLIEPMKQLMLTFLAMGGEGTEQLCHHLRLLAVRQEVELGPTDLGDQPSSLHCDVQWGPEVRGGCVVCRCWCLRC